MTSFSNVYATFIASVRSVGTAVTMAMVGVYLHQRGFVDAGGKRTLAKVSQQVTFPLFLFTKIIYCNQDWSHNPCPDVTKALGDVWVLLFWPLYVVGLGVFVGIVVTRVMRTPKHQVRAVLAACGFGNSTGLPITLLTVVHTNFPATSDLGRVDPTLFLSVYLLLYPVLQWGLGGYLLAPPRKEILVNADVDPQRTTGGSSFRYNVLNHQTPQSKYKGLTSTDEGLYMTEVDLTKLVPKVPSEPNQLDAIMDHSDRFENKDDLLMSDKVEPPDYEATAIISNGQSEYGYYNGDNSNSSEEKVMESGNGENDALIAVENVADDEEEDTLCDTITNVLDRCLQPPVVGAIVGIICAVLPSLRGIFVDLIDRDSNAPLQFLFDGLYAIGQAAVPLNMMILGCNLSSSSMGKTSTNNDNLLSMDTMIAVVIGKMIVMPIIGILTAIVLKEYFWNIPDDIDGSFYLVLMIVFLTPTANNVMVMVELSGSGASAKEGIARVIALQYAVAPVILSLTMTIAIGVASGWT